MEHKNKNHRKQYKCHNIPKFLFEIIPAAKKPFLKDI